VNVVETFVAVKWKSNTVTI